MASTPAQAPATSRVALRPERLVRVFFALCVVAAIWLSISPVHDLLAATKHADETHRQLQQLQHQEYELRAQNRDLSRGTGLEEQARRQGLIAPSERSYVIEGIR